VTKKRKERELIWEKKRGLYVMEGGIGIRGDFEEGLLLK